MIIAVDFDGTIVEHKYPAIGRELPFAIETLRKLQSERHKLILWTVREGGLLEEALSFCRERGLEFYAVNRDYPEEEKGLNNHFSRKFDLGKGLIQGTSQYIAKKMRTVKVHLKSGYKVMLYQDRD
ncbi:HAD family hydrolase [Parabacteroides distasonis]|uniref:conjugative transposon protein TraM n=1 Tax=Parabacteroides distasonis TaxID=823 RepID=UPI0009E5F53D|nr:conjugative transposon protein TraM [Parabacteroides distasonis]